MPLPPLPRVPAYALDREFLLDQTNEEVTSIDVAPHGGFCIIACSNGAILLFDITNLTTQRNGYLLTHIRPKGMHTSLRLTVKISEDSRFCFVGVRKGSSDMIAIDLAKFDAAWDKFPAFPNFGRAKKLAMTSSTELVLPMFDVYSHNDPKLRGFGTATSVPIPSESTAFAPGTMRFWLACGMGIKNVHIWQLAIAPLNPTSPTSEMGVDSPMKRDTWTCIFDVATNGSSISHLGFRNQGYELLSKCDNMNIRIWDLSQYDVDPALKPAYEDIPNSSDVKCFMEQTQFTFGGAYEFAMVKVDKNTPKEANRNVFELPDKANVAVSGNVDDEASASNQRRRRATREIADVVGTQDGMHALILCSDGFTMHYFRQNQEPKSGSPTPMHPKQMAVSDAMIATPVSDREKTKLEPGAEEDSKGATQEEDAEEGDGYDIGQVQELGTLIMDMDNRDQCWALRRVGAEGHVLLLRAIRPAGFNTKGLGTPRKSVVGTISITRLSNLVSKETVAAFANTAGSWQTFYSCPIPVDEVGLALVEPPVVPLPAASSTPLSASKVDQKSTPRLPPKTGERKRKPEMPPRADSFSTPAGKTVLATPSMQTAAGVVGGVGSRKAPRISPMEKGVTSALLTPSASPMPASIGNLPAFARSASKEESGSSRGGGGGGIAMSFSYDDSPSRPAYEPIVISPPPVRIPKAYSNAIIPVPAENWSEDAKTLHNRVQEMFKAWQLAVRPIVDRCHERQKASTIQTLSKHTQQITMTGLNQINKYLNATIQELERRIKRNLSYEVLGKDWVIYQQSKQLPSDGLLAIVERHRNTLTDDVMPRLRVELNGAAARDMIFAQVVLPSGKATELSMRLFRDCVQDYEEMVEITQDLVHQMQQAAKQSFPAREKLRIDMEDMEQHPSNLVI